MACRFHVVIWQFCHVSRTALAVIDGTIANVALPTIASTLHVTASQVANVVTLYQLILIMTLLPLSALGDVIGHKRLYQYGQMIFVLATLSCFLANSLTILLLARALQALGAAGTLSVSSALIRSIYPARQLGRGLGINSMIVAGAGRLRLRWAAFFLSWWTGSGCLSLPRRLHLFLLLRVRLPCRKQKV
jgi:MFS family permease